MQLARIFRQPASRRPKAVAVGALLGPFVLASALSALTVPPARAQSEVSATATVFRESGGPLEMTVINPSVQALADISDPVTLNAGWEADVVTGASVAVVDAPTGAGDVDAITSATTLDDLRQVVQGGITLRSDLAQITANYAYGFESDYRSHSVTLGAAAELFDRNTTLQLTYSRGFDKVCDLLQPQAEKAVERQRMPTSDGCFEHGKGRMRRPLDLHSLQGSWTQNWAPIFNTQLVTSVQLLHGFQSNPYRAVWLGRAAVQEHHPDDRARYALGVGARLWLRPLGGALQLFGRAYRDTWDVRAISAELAFERTLGQYLRLRAQGRYFRQASAAFFSDDYALNPKGEYFTGDRELSAMSSWLMGGRLEIRPSGDGDASLGFLEALRIVLKGDFLMFDFSEFHYGHAEVPNKQAILGTLGVDATF